MSTIVGQDNINNISHYAASMYYQIVLGNFEKIYIQMLSR